MLAFLIRMLIAGPLLYIAVVLLRDPVGSYDLLNLTAVGLRNLESRLRQEHRMPAVASPQPEPLSALGRLLLRLVGGALAGLAILYLIDAPH